MSWKWFSVRTIFRTRVEGGPLDVDRLYDADATLVEIRVVLIRARSPEEAISKGEIEARKYASLPHKPNRYGQEVVMDYLEECDVYWMFDEPEAGREVYSRTEILPDSVSDSELVEDRLGPEQLDEDLWRRNKFLEARFAARIGEDA